MRKKFSENSSFNIKSLLQDFSMKWKEEREKRKEKGNIFILLTVQQSRAEKDKYIGIQMSKFAWLCIILNLINVTVCKYKLNNPGSRFNRIKR